MDAAQNNDDLGPFALDNVLSVDNIATAIEDETVSFATRDYTFGNFVDAVNMRKGVEQLRRVNRSVTGERFTDLFRLLNVNRDEIVSTINNNFNWGPQFRELLLLGVQPDSIQNGAVNPDGF